MDDRVTANMLRLPNTLSGTESASAAAAVWMTSRRRGKEAFSPYLEGFPPPNLRQRSTDSAGRQR